MIKTSIPMCSRDQPFFSCSRRSSSQFRRAYDHYGIAPAAREATAAEAKESGE